MKAIRGLFYEKAHAGTSANQHVPVASGEIGYLDHSLYGDARAQQPARYKRRDDGAFGQHFQWQLR